MSLGPTGAMRAWVTPAHQCLGHMAQRKRVACGNSRPLLLSPAGATEKHMLLQPPHQTGEAQHSDCQGASSLETPSMIPWGWGIYKLVLDTP